MHDYAGKLKRISSAGIRIVAPLWLAIALLPAAAQGPQERHEHVHTGAPAAAKSAAELEADKRFSEFNHRFAGAFVLLVGLLAVLEPRLVQHFGWVRYLWSVLFFVPGAYLLVWSDPESWPIGNQTLYYVITQNMQVLQHKIFSLLLLGLGVVEYTRVRRPQPSVWLSSVFPVLAGAGALLLLFHSSQAHAAGDAAAHLAMQKVEHQHIAFSVVGFGIALSKAFADVGKFHPRLMRNLFALFMVALAVLLLTYTE